MCVGRVVASLLVQLDVTYLLVVMLNNMSGLFIIRPSSSLHGVLSAKSFADIPTACVLQTRTHTHTHTHAHTCLRCAFVTCASGAYDTHGPQNDPGITSVAGVTACMLIPTQTTPLLDSQ